MKKTLLNQAMEANVRCRHTVVSDEEKQLGVGYALGMVGVNQVAKVLGLSAGSQTYVRLVDILSRIIEDAINGKEFPKI